MSSYVIILAVIEDEVVFVAERKENWLHIALLLVIAIYIALMCWINFLGNPFFYDSDMYCDLNYMVTAWNTKSIFPDGWVFGDQFYVVATPVLAALCYGILGNPCMAMGLATTLMAAGVIAAFLWMVKPICRSRNSGLVGLTVFLLVTLFAEYPVRAITGWQIFFTMCSYYACYLISAFLSFGVYIRISREKSKIVSAFAVTACLLSFATGMHSIRQTAVMVIPLLGAESFAILFRVVKKEKLFCRSTWFVLTVAICNFAGIILINLLNFPKNVLLGSMGFRPFRDILPSILPSFKTAFSLGGRRIPPLAFGAVTVCILLWWLIESIRKKDWAGLSLIGLLTISVGAIFGASILTQMLVRDIYYFMLFPLLGVLGLWVFDRLPRKLLVPAVCLLLCAACLTAAYRTKNVAAEIHRWSGNPAPVSDYLLDNGISTIYVCWNDYASASVGIASQWDIQVGFWHAYEDVAFKKFDFLCNPDIFQVPPQSCAYIFSSAETAAIAQKSAAALGSELNLICKFDDLGLWVYTAERNLMN